MDVVHEPFAMPCIRRRVGDRRVRRRWVIGRDHHAMRSDSGEVGPSGSAAEAIFARTVIGDVDSFADCWCAPMTLEWVSRRRRHARSRLDWETSSGVPHRGNDRFDDGQE